MKRTAVAVALTALLAGSAAAQMTTPVASTSKLFFGFNLGGSSVEFDDNDPSTGRESGGGISLQLGYGFTPRFAIFLEGAGATLSHEGDDDAKVTLGHADLGARYHFTNPARKLVPYLQVAVTGRALSQNDVTYDNGTGPRTADLSYSGGAISFGAGLLYFFKPKWAFNADLKVANGDFTTFTVDGIEITATGFKEKAATSRLHFGVNWFPQNDR